MDVFHASDLSGSVSPAAFPRVSGVGDHHIVVVWQHVEHLYRDDGEGFGAFASMFDLSRNQLSCIFLVNTEQKDQQVSPDVAAMGDTMFVVTLSSYNPGSSQLVGQMFDLSGAKLGTEFQVSQMSRRYSYQPFVAALGADHAFFAWQSEDSAGISMDIFARMLTQWAPFVR